VGWTGQLIADPPELAVEVQQCLARGCDALGLDIAAPQQRQLLDYLDLLQKWNRAYNLTAIRDPLAMVTRHLLDSLAVVPQLTGSHCLDVGTGAGLPGIPLAIAMPGRDFHLLDSNGKKTRFLFQVKTALGLANITVHQARVETLPASRQYDVIMSRAFASLAAMVAATRHLLAPGGCFLAMKGAWPQDELAAIEDQCVVLGVEPLAVPGLDEQRHLVRLALRPS
jgi:16S rRNA (guanine527-N7)-methyltransferase